MGTFSVDVVTDATAALGWGSTIWRHRPSDLIAYDLEMIKPALLFADHVNLATFVADMRQWAFREYQQVRMPMRVVGLYVSMAASRNPADMGTIGIEESLLAPQGEAIALRANWGEEFEDISRFFQRNEDNIAEFAARVAAYWRGIYDGLDDSEMRPAIERGLLPVST